MTPEQIEKWGDAADDYAHTYRVENGCDDTPWSLLRDTEFARLVAADKDAEIVELKRLLTNAKSEAECMAFNFRVTNKAYVLVDRQMRELSDELKRIVGSLPAAAQEPKP